MNIVGDDYLRIAISQDGYFLKLIFNARTAHFFPYTTEHRDASLPGLCYRDDSTGDALAATIKPTQIDIRLHNAFSPAQIVDVIGRIERAIGNSSNAIQFDVNYGGKYLSKIGLNTNHEQHSRQIRKIAPLWMRRDFWSWSWNDRLVASSSAGFISPHRIDLHYFVCCC
jgi:hypothetical protein